MPSPDDNSYIDELQKSLYSRTAPDVRTKRKVRFTEKPSDVQSDWEHHKEPDPDPFEAEDAPVNRPHMSFFTKLFIFSAVFCLAAVGIGAFIFMNGSNLISADNIEIRINGPVSVSGGEPVSFDIMALNNNNVPIQLVDLTVDFPDGTVEIDNPSQALETYRKNLGDIPKGESVTHTVSAAMFGEENSEKQITIGLSYGVKGSTSVFKKSRTYDVLISSSPVKVSVSSIEETTSGQEFEMKVSIKSNSQEALRNLILKASYPFGFEYKSSNFPPLVDNASWKIGDLPPGAQRTVSIRGMLSGEDNELRVFRFGVGVASAKDPKTIATQYGTASREISIEKPFISLKVAVDGDEGRADSIGQFNNRKTVSIEWFNNLSSSVSNMQISAQVSGTAYDRMTISPDRGHFDSASDTIVWNQQTNPEFASVAPGASGNVTFEVTPVNKGTAGKPLVNPVVTISASVAGNRRQESNVPQAISSVAKRTIKVASAASLSGRIVRSSGPFDNTGPIPPRADVPTTYTVIWNVDNTTSAIADAQVIATLPPYVKWLGIVSPVGENILYDENSGLVTWNVGSVGTHTVGSPRRREAAFQISFIPSVSQTGQSPILINQAALSATDTFTGLRLGSQQAPLTTRFSTDPSYRPGNEAVNI